MNSKEVRRIKEGLMRSQPASWQRRWAEEGRGGALAGRRLTPAKAGVALRQRVADEMRPKKVPSGERQKGCVAVPFERAPKGYAPGVVGLPRLVRIVKGQGWRGKTSEMTLWEKAVGRRRRKKRMAALGGGDCVPALGRFFCLVRLVGGCTGAAERG